MAVPEPEPPTPRPSSEPARLAALDRLGAVGARPEATLDGLVRLAARLCGTSSAEINLVGEDDLWFCAARGMGTPGATVPRSLTFCTWTILDPDRPLIVEDARADRRFAENPFVVEGVIGSYAGVPLLAEGEAVGTMCVHDPTPRELDAEALDALHVLAAAAQAHLRLRRDVADLQELARTDALTGAANRRAADEALERERHRAARSGGPFAIVLLDVDRFKAFNDAHGHPAGDVLLQRAAEAWRGTLRAGDLLARWGGEEFCAVLVDCDGWGAREAADRLRAVVPGGQTCSAGVAVWDGAEDVATLVRRADRALYDAKAAGRNVTRLAP
jgi:diguanylate cyclase (GGDEF)-like protein